jgi:hypothetical protein
MAVIINQVYKTQSGRLLKVVSVKESGCHHFVEIDKKGKRVVEKRNNSGQVVHRTSVVYSEETISSFEKIVIK